MSRSIVLLVGGLVSLLAASLDAEEAILGQMYGNGVHAYFAGDYVKAHQCLSFSIKGGTKDPRCFYFRGLAYLQLGRPQEAEGDFLQGAKLESEDIGRVFNVSKALERIQGSARLTLEDRRVEARMKARDNEDERRKQRYEEVRQFNAQQLQERGKMAPEKPLELAPDAPKKLDNVFQEEPGAQPAPEKPPVNEPAAEPGLDPGKAPGKEPAKEPAAEGPAKTPQAEQPEKDPFSEKPAVPPGGDLGGGAANPFAPPPPGTKPEPKQEKPASEPKQEKPADGLTPPVAESPEVTPGPEKPAAGADKKGVLGGLKGALGNALGGKKGDAAVAPATPDKAGPDLTPPAAKPATDKKGDDLGSPFHDDGPAPEKKTPEKTDKTAEGAKTEAPKAAAKDAAADEDPFK
jgi:hypothetical protein